MPPIPPHRKRCKRWDVPGDAHWLTFSCFQRRQFLRSDRTCSWLLGSIQQAREKHGFHLWAYVIMPEHVHLVIWPREARISGILKSIKLAVARRACLWVRRNAPQFLLQMADRQPNGHVSYRFWQRGGGYDRNLRSQRDIHEKIRYTHENPLRRGLVQRLEDWAWSSWHAHETGKNWPIPLDLDSLPSLRT